ncbi:SET domain-containing protein [Sinimarinibacterium sp. NLF-5-8]|uniref:SET domain-containing protein n=1 Tax=Sinimarinibacterium sp. NLF-5-8 TaxID=2698684 RepID=UPI00137C38A1|nr:SET domain-containing protein-lysine N-methyltransferase [Sinimarinibacterium sp. NLF-5-8]QHS11053.1 SET domain-containing protein [Sinimarinibacterium sp. NLF-5-8]
MPRNLVVHRSAIHGNGVFAARDLAPGLRLIQYRGALRTHEDIDAAYGGNAEGGHTFLFTLNDEWVVDGNINGNSARWINHSCEPNCEAVIYEHAGGDRRCDRIFIVTLRPIEAGEELTFNYGIVLAQRHTRRVKQIWACCCGAPSCSGTMLQKRR